MPQITVGTAGVDIATYNVGRQTISFGNEGLTMIGLTNRDSKGITLAECKWRLAPGDTMDFSLLIDGREIRQPWAAISDVVGGLLRWGDLAEWR